MGSPTNLAEPPPTGGRSKPLSPTRRVPRWLLISGVALLGAILLVLGVIACASLANFDSKPSLWHTDGPISAEEANKRFSMHLPFPTGAKNVQVAGYSQFVAFEEVARFEASPEVCSEYALALLRAHNAKWATDPRMNVPVELRPLDKPPERVKTDPLVPAQWFDVEKIRRGFVAGGRSPSHTPCIWIDAERGIFYYHITD